MLLIDWLLTLALVGGVRMSVRVVGESRRKARKGGSHHVPGRRVLIVGAGDAGAIVVREMQNNPQLGLDPVGFLDDSPAKQRKRIYGVPVLGPLSGLTASVLDYRIDEVIVAMPSATGGGRARDRRRLPERRRAVARPCRASIELLDGQVSVSRLRNVEIADLLRREPDRRPPSRRPLLSAGARCWSPARAARSAASSAARSRSRSRRTRAARPRREQHLRRSQLELAERYPDLRSFGPSSPTSATASASTAVFERYRPDVVFHAAAHKHVPLMEDNLAEAITNNVLGTRNVVRAGRPARRSSASS